jgi:hypothetical protein
MTLSVKVPLLVMAGLVVISAVLHRGSSIPANITKSKVPEAQPIAPVTADGYRRLRQRAVTSRDPVDPGTVHDEGG